MIVRRGAGHQHLAELNSDRAREGDALPSQRAAAGKGAGSKGTDLPPDAWTQKGRGTSDSRGRGSRAARLRPNCSFRGRAPRAVRHSEVISGEGCGELFQ
ncbi:hypothetical protein DPEC_G00056400 [Dallia pectoralis]|uniref:Uncharacterized protein n=1 Tax=Dallia pectoralis TaxID=75939 RepID=A0ACC2H5R2_DALPE|nr:hypothetical protein DPEC_G00056400 [Dallia pectoralis]